MDILVHGAHKRPQAPLLIPHTSLVELESFFDDGMLNWFATSRFIFSQKAAQVGRSGGARADGRDAPVRLTTEPHTGRRVSMKGTIRSTSSRVQRIQIGSSVVSATWSNGTGRW